MKRTIKPSDLEARDNMTYHDLFVQNELFREQSKKLTEDNEMLQSRVRELSKFETMDKCQVIQENARLQTQHVEDVKTIEHLIDSNTELGKRILALEGCLSRSHNAILEMASDVSRSNTQTLYGTVND